MVSKKLILVAKLLMIFVFLSILCNSQNVIAADAYYKCSDGKYFSLTFKNGGGADLVFYGSNKVEKLHKGLARTDSNENFSFHIGSGGGPSNLSYIRKGKVIKIVDCEEIDKSSYPNAVSAAPKSVQPSSTKPDTSQCQGVIQTKGENFKNKAALEVAITKQLKDSGREYKSLKLKVTLLFAYAQDNWTILLVKLCENCDSYMHLFYSGNPLTNRYVASWEGSMWDGDMAMIKDWVLKNAPGIPPKLASCYAWHQTH